MLTIHLIILLTALTAAPALELNVIPEIETPEPSHIPAVESETKEPRHIPVDTYGERTQGEKYNNIDLEMEEDLNIEWPVQNPDPEEIRQLQWESQNMLDDRLVNGRHVAITDRPFQVFIGNCGGSIVHPNWVLTAGHCITTTNPKVKTDENGYMRSSWTVRAGSRHRNSGGEFRCVDKRKIWIHSKWRGNINQEDIVDLALMYIDKPFEKTSSIQVIEMNDRFPHLKGQTATVSGWGMTAQETHPDLLSQTSMKITADADDHNGMGRIQMLNTQGSGVCKGDSGGPATINYYGRTILVGVASYVLQKCGPGINYGVGTFTFDSANYVDIYNYMEWIKETMKEGPELRKIENRSCEDLPGSNYCSLYKNKQWFAPNCCNGQVHYNLGDHPMTMMEKCQKSCYGC